jgi:hypothetical protein
MRVKKTVSNSDVWVDALLRT